MARHGHLTDLELETLERRAAEARERVGTDREQKAALSPNFGGDKWAGGTAAASPTTTATQSAGTESATDARATAAGEAAARSASGRRSR